MEAIAILPNGLLLVGRDASLNGNLFIASRTRMNGDLSLNGNFAMYGGDASLNGLLLVGRDASLNGNLFIASRTRMNGDLSLNGNFTMYGDSSLNGLLLVGRDASLNGNLYVVPNRNVGIGKIAEYPLDVNGTIFGSTFASSSFTIENSGPDSVFENTNSSSGRMYFRPVNGGSAKGIQIDNNTGNIGIKKIQVLMLLM